MQCDKANAHFRHSTPLAQRFLAFVGAEGGDKLIEGLKPSLRQ